jgi:hypothetical protein
MFSEDFRQNVDRHLHLNFYNFFKLFEECHENEIKLAQTLKTMENSDALNQLSVDTKK